MVIGLFEFMWNICEINEHREPRSLLMQQITFCDRRFDMSILVQGVEFQASFILR